MKILFKKIVRRLFNIWYKLFYGMSFSTYMASKTNRSFDSMSAILIWMIHAVTKKYPTFTLNNMDVLEIGSGQFLSHPLGVKLLGAKDVISIDLYRQFNQKAAQSSFSQQVMAKKIFSSYAESSKYNLMLEDIKKSRIDLNLITDFGITYLAPLDLLDYNSKLVDFVISYTVLEHVPPKKIIPLLEKSIELLKSDGHFCHFIDLEDHKDATNKPFEFLENKDWSDSDCFSRGNRLRLNDWTKIFNEISEIEYEFTYILERNKNLLPNDIDKELNNYVSGILVVGQKLSND